MLLFDFRYWKELARAAQLSPEFEKRGVKMIALSCNDADMHACWIKDIEAYGKLDTTKKFPFIIVDDQDRQIAKTYGMIDPAETDSKGIPLTARAVFVIGPDKKLKLSILYPATTGRNFKYCPWLHKSLQFDLINFFLKAKFWESLTRCNWLPKTMIK